MKKQAMISALTLTAVLAAPVTFPQYALARSSQSEKQFAKEFSLISDLTIRYTTHDGRHVFGKIYIDLDQTPVKPDSQNQLHAEMSGNLFFGSDEATETDYDGKPARLWIDLAGDEGDILLDLIHVQGRERKYQIHGCTTTVDWCEAEKYQITFENNKVTLDFTLPAEFAYPLQVRKYVKDQLVTEIEWTQSGSTSMKKTILED